jgi:hypothetical protein
MSSAMPLLCAAFVMSGDPEQPARFGYLNQPAYTIDKCLRLPMSAYEPQPGDVLLFSNPNLFWGLCYAIALTTAPGHAGLVVRMSDGRLGVLEAGANDKPWVGLTPLEQRLPEYKGTIWARRRKAPITDEQSRILTCFAETVDGRRYGVVRLLLQMTVFRNRGPLRTWLLGKPRGLRNAYICSEVVLEGLVVAGLLDEETTRPSATFPRDLFFDRSPNLYVSRHPPLKCDWEAPALWRRCNCP